MKFQGSQYESDLNDYWNEHLTALDQQIRVNQLFPDYSFFRDGNIEGLVSQYMDSASFILKKIDSAFYFFEDKDYIKEYKEQTLKEIVSDLDLYSDCSNFQYHQSFTNQFLAMNQIVPPTGHFNNSF